MKVFLDAVGIVKRKMEGGLLTASSLFKRIKEVVCRSSFQSMVTLYCMRAVTILALVMAVLEQDFFDIVLCTVLVGIMLLPMEDSFKEIR